MKKPGLALIIATKSKDKKTAEAPKEDYSEKYSEMAEDLLSAIKAGDSKTLGSQLKSFIQVCLSDGE